VTIGTCHRQIDVFVLNEPQHGVRRGYIGGPHALCDDFDAVASEITGYVSELM
jgi:hypothetical protein